MYMVSLNGYIFSCHSCSFKRELDGLNDENNDGDDHISTETPPRITDTFEITQKLHLFAIVQQPQLHSLISKLESKLIDVYIDSKATRQTTLEDFFWKKIVLYCSLKEVYIEIV